MEQQNRQNNKPQMNMPRFNMNWIYGLVIIALVMLYFTQGSEKSSVRTETSYSDFKTMVMKGYAEKIVVNKYENTLQMYVKPEHIRDVFHQGVDKTGKDPSVMVAIGSVDQVEQFINQAREEQKFSGKFAYDNSKENEFFSSLLMNILFFCGIILVWMYLMRRMGGGAGACGGLNIPVGIGVKYKLKPRVNLGFEWTMRFSSTDKLDATPDGTQLKDPYGVKSSMFKNKDSYSFAMFFITYDMFPKYRKCNN